MNLLKIVFCFFVFLNILNAKDIKPVFTYIASAGVTDLIYSNNKIYAATSGSSVDIFDTKTKRKIDSIKLPKIKDFMGDLVDSKIYSVDVFEDMVLILSQGEKGGRDINIYKDGISFNI